MRQLTSSDVLFVGKGREVVPWYRTGMPSFHLGCDWVGVTGEPGNFDLATSLKRGGHSLPKFDDYAIVILQQVRGQKWLREILRIQRLGIKVIYEVDDYLHGVRKVEGHIAKKAYSKKLLPEFEMCMRACDAMIVSTGWLAKKYRVFNKKIFICKNGIEVRRYGQFKRPERRTLNIGWAGGVGHLEAIKRWLPAVQQILDEFEDVRFVSIGLPFAKMVDRPEQSVALPFTSIENFPAVMTHFDIAIAPAGRSSFYAAKSDLRFLETAAMGIPLVADPFVYNDIKDGVTGLLAEESDEAYAMLCELISSSDDLRGRIGKNAREYVTEHRSIEKAIEQWENVFREIG